ncbi:hypothetical protein B0H34DRAFT_683354 [Crassisporium funariophilum]|nr:hypothetical protein B0H34DRAFT_683354 [Crassisporium funariophilum]
MLQSATTSGVQPNYECEQLTPRRIRHITSVQIRNLTPFPVRDAFTSALSQPAEQSHFGATGVTDDLGAIASRKRARKVSANSTATRRSLKWEDGTLGGETPSANDGRARTGSASRITFASTGNISTSPSQPGQPFSASRSTPSLRSHRARTSSMTSSSSNHLPASSLQFVASSSSALSGPSRLSDNSQSALERVIGSRLVETFITIAVPSVTPTEEAPMSSASSPPFRSPSSPGLRSATLRKATVLSPTSPTSRVMPKSAGHTKDPSTVSSPNRKRFDAPQISSSPRVNNANNAGQAKQETRVRTPATPRVNGSSTSQNTTSKGKGKTVANLPIESESSTEPKLSPPVYFSPIHRPSTNPSFPIDPSSINGFHWADSCGHTLNIEVWAKMPSHVQRPDRTNEDTHHDWKLLDEWEVNLEKLVPLPDDLDANPTQLPSNTIVVSLSPPGQAFYLPSPMKHLSRSSTPSVGYTSDPESEIRKAKQLAEPSQPALDLTQPVDIVSLSRRRRHKRIGSTSDSRDTTKTAGWQELFKLVTLQSCILDNETSLSEVVRKIDGILEEDEAFVLRRDISEREARIRDFQAKRHAVLEQCAKRKLEIADRAQLFQERTEFLESARYALTADTEMDGEIQSERILLLVLQDKMRAARTSLLSTLSAIFPIELYSPSELLFTILDVPLPIPLTSNDPAPPLSLPEHKDVTEEAVATALGYTAQVLQILAAYLGKNLVYPVTCIGSRSLIRDGISAMVGPRMFPLFSRGVDTYRFEYGVFLLNKDVEMLMAERDLRALDIRHTLPNLKNLLLTLSHDDPSEGKTSRRPISPISSVTGLETPSRESSPVQDEIRTPKASQLGDPRGIGEGTTPTASGSTTPTTNTMTDDSRKARPFLGFVPFTEFLRGRYPSSSQPPEKLSSTSHTATEFHSDRSEPEESDDDVELGEDSDVDEEDRNTIHGVATESQANGPNSHGAAGKGMVGIGRPSVDLKIEA